MDIVVRATVAFLFILLLTRIVGRRERIGRLAGVWRDTLLLERRSSQDAGSSAG